jgi:hypothetical protein
VRRQLVATTLDSEAVRPITDHLEAVAAQTGRRPPAVFDEWLAVFVATLARDDDIYYGLIDDLEHTLQGDSESARVCLESYSRTFAALIETMEDTTLPGSDLPGDPLGTLYERYAETSDDFGQHFTPDTVAVPKAQLAFPDESRALLEPMATRRCKPLHARAL